MGEEAGRPQTRTYAPDDLVLLEAAFASLHEGVTVHDAGGRIVACNPAAARLLGLTVDEVLGTSSTLRSALDVRYTDDTPVTAENSAITRVLETGEPERGCVLQFRTPGRPDPRWVRCNFHPLLHDGDARPWGVVCSFVDVTDTEGAAAQLHGFSRQLRTVLADESAAVYVKDRDGRYLYANRRLGQLVGMPRQQILGRTDAEILPPDVARECARSNAAAFEGRRVVQAEETFMVAGELQTYLTVKFPLLDDADEPWAIAGVSIDITERTAGARERAHGRLQAAAAVAPVLADLALVTKLASRRRLTVVVGPEPPGWSVSLVGGDDRAPLLRGRGATIAEALQEVLEELDP